MEEWMAKFRELSKWEIMSKAADHLFLVFFVSVSHLLL